MEMASGCPRQASVSTENIEVFPQKPVRGPHGGWQRREIDALCQRIEQAERSGESLRSVFDEMGERLGRKPNSIRNFYYAQLRDKQDGSSQRALPFETFTPQEIEQLIRSVLTARAQGMSVRSCVRQLSGGDKARMLRLQNKYRSVIRTRPELVGRIMASLREEGVAFVSPYPGDEQALSSQITRCKSRAERFADPQITQLFSSLEYLLALAARQPEPEESPASCPQDAAALRRADRLSAQLDVARIALDDERMRTQRLRRETEGMVTVLKEFIALPQNDRNDRCAAFCQHAAAQLSAVECALMEE